MENTYNTLAEIRPLSRHLEVKPLLDEKLLWGSVKAQRVLGIISLGEIFNDCTGLPEVHAGVWIFDRGNTSIDTESLIRILLEFRKIYGSHRLSFPGTSNRRVAA